MLVPGRRAPGGELGLLLGGEHAAVGEDGGRRHREALPLGPSRLVHRGDHGLHDVRVEARPQSRRRLLEVGDPGVDERRVAQEGPRGGSVGERGRPRGEEGAEVGGILRIGASRRVSLQHDEPAHQVGMTARGEERGVRAHRLSDQRHPPVRREPLDHGDGIRNEGVAGEIVGSPRAAAMTALVEQQHAMPVGERVRRGHELARAARQPVQQQDRGTRPSRLGHRERDAVTVDDGAAVLRHPSILGCRARPVSENAPSSQERTPHGAFSARWCVLGASYDQRSGVTSPVSQSRRRMLYATEPSGSAPSTAHPSR